MNSVAAPNSGVVQIQPELVSFGGPRVKLLSEEAAELGRTFDPYWVYHMLTPNYTSSVPQVAPDIARAFGLRPGEYPSMPRGYAVKIDGDMPLDTPARINNTLALWDTGLGTSKYTIERFPEDLVSANNDTVAALTRRARDKLPHLISPSHRVSIERSPNQFGQDSYVVFVKANDVPAARELAHFVSQRAARGNPWTLEELVRSKEYQRMHKTAQRTRDYIARTYASAYGATLANSGAAAHTTLTHSIVPANNLAHGVHPSVSKQKTRESRYYVVYNDASDTNTAPGGELVLEHGLMGGHTVLANKESRTGWQQPQFLSAMPASSGEAVAGHTKQAAVHTNDDQQTRSAYNARVTWHTELGDKFEHGGPDPRYYALSDATSAYWLDKLAPSNKMPLLQRPYSVIVAQRPNVTVLYASTDQLASLARHRDTPQWIPLALDHPLVSTIPALYDPVIRASGSKETLRSIFTQVDQLDQTTGSLGRLYERSALDDENADDLYLTDTQAGTLRQSACGAHMHSRGRDISTLRTQLRLPAEPPYGYSQSYIKLSKDLVALITPAPK